MRRQNGRAILRHKDLSKCISALSRGGVREEDHAYSPRPNHESLQATWTRGEHISSAYGGLIRQRKVNEIGVYCPPHFRSSLQPRGGVLVIGGYCGHACAQSHVPNYGSRSYLRVLQDRIRTNVKYRSRRAQQETNHARMWLRRRTSQE